MSSKHLTRYILIALVLGILAGYIVNSAFEASAATFASRVELLPFAFLRLIKMIIAPLVFSTLVVGIGKMGDIATVGRVGGKALGWFVFASLISLTLGLLLVQALEPGKAMQLAIPEAGNGFGRAEQRAHTQDLHRAPDPGQHRRRDVAQRDPADRGVLAVLRRRHGGARRARQAGRRSDRHRRARHAEGDRLRDAVRAARRVRRARRHRGQGRSRRSSASTAFSWASSTWACSSCGPS